MLFNMLLVANLFPRTASPASPTEKLDCGDAPQDTESFDQHCFYLYHASDSIFYDYVSAELPDQY